MGEEARVDQQTSGGGLSRKDRVMAWLDERLPLEGARKLMAKKKVPRHKHSIWYYFGGMTLFLFGTQIFTGILLLLYYRPTAESAFESVQFIMTKVEFGWMIRSIHSWSANLMVGAAFVHLFSVFFLRAYRKPREFTWVSGVLLLFISLGFGFTGYLLPWNRLAFFATKVGTEIVSDIPLIGHWLLIVLRGGEEVTGATLTRLFGVHVAVLPILVAVVLGLHLFLVQHHGMSVPMSVEKEAASKKPMPFVPNFLLRDVLGWLVALAILAALAAHFPWELGEKADPFEPAPPGIRPEWYFMFMFETLKWVPARILFFEGEVLAILFFGLCAVLLILVPFLDFKTQRGERSPIFTAVGIFALSYIVVVTVYAYWKAFF
jgi:cytochrome b6